jgi:hypothetical protein
MPTATRILQQIEQGDPSAADSGDKIQTELLLTHLE